MPRVALPIPQNRARARTGVCRAPCLVQRVCQGVDGGGEGLALGVERARGEPLVASGSEKSGSGRSMDAQQQRVAQRDRHAAAWGAHHNKAIHVSPGCTH